MTVLIIFTLFIQTIITAIDVAGGAVGAPEPPLGRRKKVVNFLRKKVHRLLKATSKATSKKGRQLL